MCIVICTLLLSRPARGAWVEISLEASPAPEDPASRPARGAWVEIPYPPPLDSRSFRRAPQGARGLKLIVILSLCHLKLVAPRKGRVG